MTDLPDRRVKVLHLITKFVDGAGMNTLLTVTGLKRLGYDVVVAGGPGGNLYAEAEQAGVRTHVLPHMKRPISPLHDLLMLLQLYRLFRRESFTIVHTHSSKAGVLGRVAARLARVPIIIHTVHGFAFHEFARPFLAWFYVNIERLCARLSSKMIFVARRLANEAATRGICSPQDAEVIYSAIDFDSIASRHVDPATIKRRFGIPSDDSVVASVGRLDCLKNFRDLINAAELVLREHPNTTFIIIGEGPQRGKLAEQARVLGLSEKLVLAGYHTDIPAILSCVDVYAITSLYEGLGRAMTEALASGKPVVANAINAIPELVVDGVTGFLVTPRDPRMLAKKIGFLLSNPDQARLMGENARKAVGLEFHPETMVRKIAECYERLLCEVAVPAVPPSRCSRT
jgi:glycosyltransferase involved in cell wall biosynthesis